MSKSTPDLKSIFAHAFELDSADDRERYLADACHGDAALRGQVESLLKAFAGAGDSPESHVFSTLTPEECHDAEAPSEVIDQYKLLEQIGEGGMGVVYMAEQTQPIRRKVALKIIKPGMDSRQVIARFEAERQALALMDHPNIAKVFDAGSTATRPPLLRHGAGQGDTDHRVLRSASHLTPRERLELFVSVCQAIQHAHQKGHHPPRHQAVERAGLALRRQAGAQGDRLRRGQGDRSAADRADAVHAARRDRRDARIHEPRAGREQRARRRHAQRRLLAGRLALRAVDRNDAARAARERGRPATRKSCGAFARKSRPAEHAALEDRASWPRSPRVATWSRQSWPGWCAASSTGSR